MKNILSYAVALLFAINVLSAELVNVSGASNVALNGYDPVAFFTMGEPVNGDPGISATHDGANYFFSTKEHRRLFKENPYKYAPQYGGYCTFGVSVGALFPVANVARWGVIRSKGVEPLGGRGQAPAWWVDKEHLGQTIDAVGHDGVGTHGVAIEFKEAIAGPHSIEPGHASDRGVGASGQPLRRGR